MRKNHALYKAVIMALDIKFYGKIYNKTVSKK